MEAEKSRPDEAFALERVADAAREVQVASAALKVHFSDEGRSQPSTLELARFAAAMQELKDAREAFDQLIASAQTTAPPVAQCQPSRSSFGKPV